MMLPSLRHRLLNLLHSALLLAGMGLIAWICTSAFVGTGTSVWVLAGLLVGLLIAPAVPKRLLLSAYGARRLTEREFPEGAELLRRLSSRAGISSQPELYYLPSAVPNAFAVGGPGDSVVAISDGLLRLLGWREFAGVIAHEISHIANRDLWIMALADVLSRATALLSFAGQFVLVLNLPLLLLGLVTVPWIVPIILIFAPTLMSLLQLALSRARELDADLGAAKLTGDPMGLAMALSKLERRRGHFWEEIVLPGRRIPEPSLLRTHPPTEQRIARLREMEASKKRTAPAGPSTGSRIPIKISRVHHPPRLRWTGLWY
jgi:heat shock protein HtpX